jgi:hypothetical protein
LVTGYRISEQPAKGVASISGSDLVYIAPTSDYGMYALKVVATDDSAAESSPVRISFEVLKPNKAPYIYQAVKDIAQLDTTIVERTLTTIAKDPDGDVLSFSVKQTTNGVASYAITAGKLRVWSAGNTGSDTLVVTATDGFLSVADTFIASVPTPVVAEVSVATVASTVVDTATVTALTSVVTVTQTTTQAGAIGWNLSGCSEATPCQKAQLDLPTASSVSVQILDNTGAGVISWSGTLSTSDFAALPATTDGRRTAVLSWNLNSATGSTVASGVYLWNIRVTGADGKIVNALLRMGVTR